jgi:hypothetical protein
MLNAMVVYLLHDVDATREPLPCCCVCMLEFICKMMNLLEISWSLPCCFELPQENHMSCITGCCVFVDWIRLDVVKPWCYTMLIKPCCYFAILICLGFHAYVVCFGWIIFVWYGWIWWVLLNQLLCQENLIKYAYAVLVGNAMLLFKPSCPKFHAHVCVLLNQLPAKPWCSFWTLW